MEGELVFAQPRKSCSPLDNSDMVAGRIVLIQRGGCMFAEKVRNAQNAGAIGVIVAGFF